MAYFFKFNVKFSTKISHINQSRDKKKKQWTDEKNVKNHFLIWIWIKTENRFQVLYEMFEAFVHIGEANLLPIDYVSGFIAFFVVSLGGVLIGAAFAFFTSFVTKYEWIQFENFSAPKLNSICVLQNLKIFERQNLLAPYNTVQHNNYNSNLHCAVLWYCTRIPDTYILIALWMYTVYYTVLHCTEMHSKEQYYTVKLYSTILFVNTVLFLNIIIITDSPNMCGYWNLCWYCSWPTFLTWLHSCSICPPFWRSSSAVWSKNNTWRKTSRKSPKRLCSIFWKRCRPAAKRSFSCS